MPPLDLDEDDEGEIDTAEAMVDLSSRSRERRCFHLIGNARAGTVLEGGADAFSQRIERAFAQAGCEARVQLLPPRQLHDGLREALRDEGATVVLAGGDGTVNRALPVLAQAKAPVAILPLGTVNVLGRDLGLTGSLEEQIAAICRGEPLAMDLGTVNDRLFHSISGMGFFSLMAREREYARRRFPFSRAMAFAFAATRSILFTRSIAIELQVDGEPRRLEADAVLVTVNAFDAPDWQRSRLDAGELEIHILRTGGLLSRSKAALSMLTGSWRSSDNLISLKADAVSLTRRDKRSGHVTFDGEVERRAGRLDYGVVPGALHIIAPRPAQI